MQVFRQIDSYVSWRRGESADHGFVATMGALHAGHLALVGRARATHDVCSASIFVNPLQFGVGEDLSRYPRPLERDLALLEEAGVDAVLVPALEDMYPPGFVTKVQVTGPLAERLEAAARPGHFDGVATVVTRLLNIARPRIAYFGQKDAQQVLVVSHVARDLAFGCDIAVVPTVREPDGLALSSRNVYLNDRERQTAPTLHQALGQASRLFEQGERDASTLRMAVREVLNREPTISVEYVSVCSVADFSELDRLDSGGLVVIACRLGATRLIDNTILGNASLS